jgi:hypothetical protein
VEANPDRARYRQTLAWACFASGLGDQALEQIQRALDLERSTLRRRGLREDLERLRARIDGARIDWPGSTGPETTATAERPRRPSRALGLPAEPPPPGGRG